MKKYAGLALIGFCGIFIVMIFIYAYGILMQTFGEGASDYDMDFLVPRLIGTLAGLVICILMALKGLRLITGPD